VLGALKAFSMWRLGPLQARYLDGSCASGLHEALLAHDYYDGEVHVFSAAYSEADLRAILPLANHLVFNSMGQWQRFRPLVQQYQRLGNQHLEVGLRVNPEHSEGAVAIYDPCAPCSRLGIPRSELDVAQLDGVSGLHFHTLCEQGFDALDRTLNAFEQRFGDVLESMSWINFGGGHHITAPGYDIEGLIQRIREFSAKYEVQVYLEPGEAVAIRSGVLVTEVLDIAFSGMPQAILDTSATCHMPDVLEMPYRPGILGGHEMGERPHGYRLGGMTCLAGDVIGDYSFERPLEIGQRLMFDDMSHYTMVKTTTFNGIRLPSIALWDSRTDTLEMVRTFGYEDFRDRLS
jgi:carboxynorspermidine decarboxylase